MANNNDKFISRENAKTLWGYMIDLLTGKQNKLTFDETPTQSSDNPVKSGGIFTALAGKGTYSKPQNGIPKTDLESAVQTSLGKADSALQSETDPTVPSWAKATNKPSYTQDEVVDGTTYKRVNQTEKDTWNGKQNALNTTQMQAVNSGITSEGVAQIGTNQANILYSLNTGVKNELDNFGTTSYESSGVTFTFNEDGSVHIKGTATGGNAAFYYYTGRYLYISNIYKGHILSGVTGGAEGTYGLLAQYSNNGTSWATQEMCKTAPITIKSDYNYVNICIIVFSGQTVDTTIYPMLCTPEAWAQSTDFQPPAKSNSTLTRLESEDRAALAEVVDSGAKNKLQYDLKSLKAANTDGTWNNNAYTINGITYTLNPDMSISISGTKASGVGAIFNLADYTPVSGDVMSQGTVGTYNVFFYARGGSSSCNGIGNTLIESTDIGVSRKYALAVTIEGSAVNQRYYPMICTLADWKVSQKYVPYRMPYSQALTLLNQKAPSGVADYVASGSADNLPSGCALCNSNVTNMPALTGNYFIIRTRIYDANCAEQEAVAPAGNRRFNRTKWGGTWTAWEEYTKS